MAIDFAKMKRRKEIEEAGGVWYDDEPKPDKLNHTLLIQIEELQAKLLNANNRITELELQLNIYAEVPKVKDSDGNVYEVNNICICKRARY